MFRRFLTQYLTCFCLSALLAVETLRHLVEEERSWCKGDLTSRSAMTERLGRMTLTEQTSVIKKIKAREE